MDVVEKDESSEEPAGLSEAITQREELIFNEDWLKMSKTTQLKSLHQRHPWCVGKAWKNGVGVDESARPGEWAWPSRGHLGACTQCHTGPSLAWCPGARSNLRPNLGMNSSIPGLRAGASKTRICQRIPKSWAAPLPGPLLQGNHTSGLISSFWPRLCAVSCSPRHKNDSFGVSTQWLNLGVVSCFPNTNNSYLFHHLLFLNWVNTQVT